MASYFLYKNSKKWFQEQINAANDPLVLPNVKGWGPEVTFFTACLRGVLKFGQDSADLDKGGGFKHPTTLQAIRLDKRKEVKTNQNILYRMALEYDSFLNFSSGGEKLETKSDFVNAATGKFHPPILEDFIKLIDDYQKPFESNVLSSSLIDKITYECMTKQAFYRWHKMNFVDNTALKDIIKEGSDWSKVDVKDGPKFFIAPDGGPFNSGFPTICVIMDTGLSSVSSNALQDLKSQKDKFFATAGDLVARAFSRTYKKDTWTKKSGFVVHPFNRANAENAGHMPFRMTIVHRPNSNKVKICIGFDYANVVLFADHPESEIHKLDAVKVALNYFVNRPDPNDGGNPSGLSVSFPSTKKTDALEAIDDAVGETAETLLRTRRAMAKLPPCYIKKDKVDVLAKELDNLKYDNENLAKRAMKKRQYKLNSPRIANGLFYIYSGVGGAADIDLVPEASKRGILVEAYEKQRNTDPQFKKYDDNTINEAVTFLYDKERNLLAITAKRNLTKAELKIATQKIKKENNSIPFDIFVYKKVNYYNSYYSLLALDINRETSFVDRIKDDTALNQGIDTDVALVTDLFVNRFKNEYDNIFPSSKLKDYASNIFAATAENIKTVEDDLKKDSLFDPENDKLNSNIPFVLPYKILIKGLGDPTRRGRFLRSKGVNNFFIFSEQLKKELEGDALKILKTQKYKKKRSAEYSATLQKLVDSYYYPPLEIRPSAKKDEEELPSKEPEEKQVENAPGAEKVVDVDNYNSASKAYVKDILLVEAQASNSACFNDLAQLLAGPGDPLVNLADYIFTKFPWRQLLMQSIQDKARKLKEAGAIADAASAQTCLTEMDELNNAFLRLKNAFLFFDGIVDASLPDMYTIPDIPYVPILDFTEQFKKQLIQAIIQAIVASVGVIIGSVLEELQKACNNYDTFMDAVTAGDKNKSGTGASQQNPGAVALGQSAGQLPGYGDSSKLDMVNVSIVKLLIASKIDTLENIYSKIKYNFELYDSSTGEFIENDLLTEYFNVVSETLDSSEVRSLLINVASPDIVGLVVDVAEFSNAYPQDDKGDLINPAQKPIVSTFGSKTSVIDLFNFLALYIDIDLLNEGLASGTVIVPDPCDAGNKEDLLLNDLDKKGFKPDDSTSIVSGDKDDLVDNINKLCAALEGASGNIIDQSGFPLIGQQAKQDLSIGIIASVSPVESLQQIIRMSTKTLFNSTFGDLINYINGVPLTGNVNYVSTKGALAMTNKDPLNWNNVINTVLVADKGFTITISGPPKITFGIPNPIYNENNSSLNAAQKAFIISTFMKAQILLQSTAATNLAYKSLAGTKEYTISIKSTDATYKISFEKKVVNGESQLVLIIDKLLGGKKLGPGLRISKPSSQKQLKQPKLIGPFASSNKSLATQQDAFKEFFMQNVLFYGGKNNSLKERGILKPLEASTKKKLLSFSALALFGKWNKLFRKRYEDVFIPAVLANLPGDFIGSEEYNFENSDYVAAIKNSNIKQALKSTEVQFIQRVTQTLNKYQTKLLYPINATGVDLRNPKSQEDLLDAFLKKPEELQKKYVDIFENLVDEGGSAVEEGLNNLLAFQKINKTLEKATPEPPIFGK